MASGTWSTGFWGQNQWNDLANASFTVTGIALTANLGTPTEVTGEINSGWGRLEWGINGWNIAGTLIPTGVAGTFSLGSITTKIDVTPTIGNFGLTAALASVSAVPSQEVDVTVISMNAQLASVTTVIHVDISVTGLGLTMNQGNGNALIWNEVDTGSAPIDPPGWREVAA